MRIGLAVLLILFVLPVSASELRITVQGIRSPHGTILIGLYDSLESFTRATLGVPTEPYGFSNNMWGFLGPPAHEEAVMEVTSSDKAVRIVLIYHDLTGTYIEEPDYK